MGSVACTAIAPMLGTVVLGREMTLSAVWHSTLGCALGPVGWLLADALVPTTSIAPPTQPQRQPPPRRTARGRRISIPSRGTTDFVPDVVLLEIAGGATQRQLDLMARRLHLTHIETQRFTLIDRTLQRWRITGNASVATTLQRVTRYRIVIAAQPNYLYGLTQQSTRGTNEAGAAQYAVAKLRLIEAHKLSTGAEVRVAVIDS